MGVETSKILSALSAIFTEQKSVIFSAAIILCIIIFSLLVAHQFAKWLYPWSLRNPLLRVLFLPWLIKFLLTRRSRCRSIGWWLEIWGNLRSDVLGWFSYTFSLFLLLCVAWSLLEFSGTWLLKPKESSEQNPKPLVNKQQNSGGSGDGSISPNQDAVTSPKPEPHVKPATVLEKARAFFASVYRSLSYYQSALCLISLFISAHLYMFSRFSNLPVPLSAGDHLELTANQQEVFCEIMARIRLYDPRGEPLVIGIEGEWGTGKSWLMREVSRVLSPRACLAISELSAAAQSPNWQVAKTRIKRILHPDWLPPCHEKWLPRNSELGKSTSRPREFVFISVNAWEYATEHDLHWGLLESLLKHTLVPAPWSLVRTNFMRYPLVAIPVFLMRALAQAFDRGQFSLPGGMSFSVSLSGMLWHPQIDRIIDELRSDNRQVVWCLDEIDRSSPEMAQAAITMIRRFLDQTGSIVLTPYVAHQLSWKVFHPLTSTRPDLESNMLAVLYHQLQQKIEDDPKGLLLQEWLRLPDGIPASQTSSIPEAGPNKRQVPVSPESEPRARTHDPKTDSFGIKSVIPPELGQLPPDLLVRLTAAEPAGSLARRLRWTLLVHGLSGNAVSRRQRIFLFEEKYLRQAHLKLSRLSGADVQSIFDLQDSFPQIHDPIWELVEIFLDGENEEQLRNDLFNIVRKRLAATIERAIQLRTAGTGKRPVLRHFLDELRMKLVKLVRKSRDSVAKGGTPDNVFLVLLGPFGSDAARELQRFAATEGERSLSSRLAGLIILVTLLAYIRAGSLLMQEQH